MSDRDVTDAIHRGEFGTALRLGRLARDLSQDHVARDTGFDRSLISRWETGKRQMTIEQFQAVARVVGIQQGAPRIENTTGVPIAYAHAGGRNEMLDRRTFMLAAGAAALTAGQTVATPSKSVTAPTALLQARLKAAILHASHGAPQRLETLTELLGSARRHYRTARYFDLSRTLQTAVATAEHGVAEFGSPKSHALLAATYNAVARALFKMPASGLEWIAIDRALRSARLAGEPILLAETRRILATAHRREGNYDDALVEFTDTADALIAEKLHLTGTTTIETFCAAAYAAAKKGDRERARELIHEATILSRYVSNDRQHWTAVDPATNIDVYRVSIGTALYDPGESLRAIASVALHSLPTTERKARFLVDSAAARLAAGQLDYAAETLLLAYRVAPQEVPTRATAQSVAATLRELRPELNEKMEKIGFRAG